jgi:hypothetical protein
MISDASDAPQRFGAEQSPLYEGLKWAMEVRKALDGGLGTTVRELRTLDTAIADLPLTGAPGDLARAAREELDAVADKLAGEDFITHGADLATALTGLEARVAETVRHMTQAQAQRLREADQDLNLIPEWSLFTVEEQSNALAELERLPVAASEDVAGLKKLIARQYDIETTVSALKTRIVADARARQLREREAAAASSGTASGGVLRNPPPRRTLTVPARIATVADLDALVRRLQAMRAELAFVEYDLVIGGED